MTYNPYEWTNGELITDVKLNHIEDGIGSNSEDIEALRGAYGTPLVASSAADMTDTNKIYVYVGNEAGYTNGHWYYYNGTAWADGGAYNAMALVTDTTLSIAGEAADAKATGDAVNDLKSATDELKDDIDELNDIILPVTSDIYTNTIACTAGTGIVSTINQLSVSIPLGEKYTIRFDDDGCLSADAVINVYENELNAPVGTVTYRASANETYEKTATKNIGWISIYITGTAITSNGTIKLTLETHYETHENSLVTLTENLLETTADNKSKIQNLEGALYSTFVTEEYHKTTEIPGNSIVASTHIFDVPISKGQYFSFSAAFTAEKYAIYADGSLLFPELLPNTKYYFQATQNITYLSIYSNTITSESIDFKLELIDFDAFRGTDYINARIDGIANGYLYIPYLPMVGYYNSNGSTNHTMSGNEYHTSLIAVVPGEEIDVSLVYDDSTATVSLTVMLYNASKEIQGRDNVNLSATGKYEGTYTVPANTFYISFQAAMRDGGTFTVSKKLNINGLSVPAYYNVDSYLQNKIRTIANTIANAHGDYDVFIFNTDQHWRLNAKNSPKLIHYICDCIPINKMFLGGDLDDGINLQASKAFADAFDGDEYKLIGNHEFMNYVFDLNGKGLSTEITDSLLCAYYGTKLANVVFGNAERLYYYFDDTARKMRYIVLSVFTDNGQSAKYQFEVAQQTWFSNTALNLPDGYTCVVLTHVLYRVEYGTGNMTLIDPTVLQPIVDIINNYSGGGEIACVFAGHTHLDGVTTLQSGVPVFVTTCDKYKAYISNGEDTEPWITEGRHLGTITEQAFDVVVIDKYNKRVSAVRIGAPAYNGGDTELEVRVSSYGS